MPDHRLAVDQGYAWAIVAISLYAVTASMLFRFVFPVLLVALLEEFSWSRTLLSGVFSLHLLAYGIVAPWVGHAVDRWNRRAVLVLGGVGLAGAFALMPLVSSPLALYAVYGVVGGVSASALGLVPHTKIVAQWFVRRRGTALGAMVSGIGIAMLLVPLVQRALTTAGWRVTLIVLGVTVAVTVCPLAALGQVDPPATAAASGAGVNPPDTSRHPSFRGLAVAFACFGCFAHLVIAHEVALLVDLGYAAALAGASIAVIGVLSLMGNVLWGAVADRRGPRTAVTAAFAACVATVVALMLLHESSPLILVVLQLLVFGLAFGTPTALSALAAQQLGGPRFGQVFGIITVAFSVGSVAGPLLAGVVHDVAGDYAWSFAMVGVVVVLGWVAAWRSTLPVRTA